MKYLCPKCGWFMNTISTLTEPPCMFYKCVSCGYKSKMFVEQPRYAILPKDLQSEEVDADEIQHNR